MSRVAPRRFALLGDPVAHSRSPAMHAAAFRALGLPHGYEAIRAAPSELAAFVDQLRRGTFDGFNVTVPHKQRILEHVDAVDAAASEAGAANTLVKDDEGRIVAYNTDVRAVAHELSRLGGDAARERRDRVAIVLGTGGAARAAITALLGELGAKTVVVRARRLETPEGRAAFGSTFRPGPGANLVCEGLTANEALDARALFVVQATSAGMEGADPGDPVARAVAWEALPDRAVALDVVYAPRSTPFLARAAARGLRHANGLGMLAAQGAGAFELWLGVPAPFDAMLAAIS